MKKNEHRMKFIHIVWWTLCLVLSRAFFAALILFIFSFFAVFFNLDQVLRVSFVAMLKIYLLVFAIYLVLEVSKKIIYLRFDDTKLVAWSLFRRYSLDWKEIVSVDREVRRPRWIGLAQIGNPPSPASHEMLVIKTKTLTIHTEVSLKGKHIFTESFPFSTAMVSDLRNYWLNATTIL